MSFPFCPFLLLIPPEAEEEGRESGCPVLSCHLPGQTTTGDE